MYYWYNTLLQVMYLLYSILVENQAYIRCGYLNIFRFLPYLPEFIVTY